MGKPSNSTQDLHEAARSGDLVAVQRICSSNPLAVNSRDKHSRTPLHLAAWAGQTQVVNFLCKNKADIGAAAMDDMTAVHFAAQKGHVEVVKTLVSNGVSVKSTNRKGMTPLHYAVQGSFVDLIKYLVKKGSNVSLKNKSGKSPLDLASSEEIRSLLSCASELKEKNDNNDELKTEESQLKSDLEGQTEASRSEEDEGKKEEPNKRKVEDDVSNEVKGGKKKTKVALNHLLTLDDTQEEED